MKQLMLGNEAVARGLYEAGCSFVSSYPGTPSTEILENIANYKEDIYCQWACNEKVAVEIACGAFGMAMVTRSFSFTPMARSARAQASISATHFS